MIIPAKEKKAIHPWQIFMAALKMWRPYCLKIALVNFLIMLPTLFLGLWAQSMLDLARIRTLTPRAALLLFLVLAANTIFAIWASTVIYLIIHGLLKGEKQFNVGANLRCSGKYFIRILGTTLLSMLVVFGIMLGGGIAVALLTVFSVMLNKVLGIIVAIIGIFFTLLFIVYFVIRWGLGSISCIVEDLGPLAALRRSRSLVRRYVNPYVGLWCILSILMLILVIPMLIIQVMLVKSFHLSWLPLSLQYIVGAIAGPLLAFVWVKFYLELREAVNNVHA